MCYTGKCKHENHYGDCSLQNCKLPNGNYGCPPESDGLDEDRVIKVCIKTIHIDKTPDGKLYRYNIVFDDMSTHGSCFCHETLEDVLDALATALMIENKSKGLGLDES